MKKYRNISYYIAFIINIILVSILIFKLLEKTLLLNSLLKIVLSIIIAICLIVYLIINLIAIFLIKKVIIDDEGIKVTKRKKIIYNIHWKDVKRFEITKRDQFFYFSFNYEQDDQFKYYNLGLFDLKKTNINFLKKIYKVSGLKIDNLNEYKRTKKWRSKIY